MTRAVLVAGLGGVGGGASVVAGRAGVVRAARTVSVVAQRRGQVSTSVVASGRAIVWRRGAGPGWLGGRRVDERA